MSYSALGGMKGNSVARYASKVRMSKSCNDVEADAAASTSSHHNVNVNVDISKSRRKLNDALFK